MPKMSQHIQHHHPQQPQYVHYTGPPGSQLTVAPQDTTRQPQSTPQPSQQPAQQQSPQQHEQQGRQPVASTSTSTQSAPLVATGDWTKDLVHLAKTAELKYVFNTSSLLVLCGLYICCLSMLNLIQCQTPILYTIHSLATLIPYFIHPCFASRSRFIRSDWFN